MKKKEYWTMLIVILITNLFCILVFSIAVLADETEKYGDHSLDMKIIYKEQELIRNEEDIYFLNDSVSCKFPEEINNRENEIDELIESIIKEHEGLEPEVKTDVYLGMSKWDGTTFPCFEEIGEEVLFCPNDEDVYNRTAVKFKCIKAYKIYYGDSFEGVYNITYISEPYQFIFDKTPPVIERTDESDYSEPISAGDIASFRIKDVAGISSVEVFRNDNNIDVVNISSEKRMIEYEYNVSLVKENSSLDEIRLVVKDISGNSSETFFSYNIDNQAPELKIYGGDGELNIENGVIFKGNTSIKIESIDNAQKSNVFYKCMYSGGNKDTVCIEDVTKELLNNEQLERTYVDDGVYDIVAFSYDESGNYSDTYRVSFGIDKSAPEVSLKNVINGYTYNSPVCVFATLNELFFGNVSANIEGTISDNSGERALDISEFSIGAKRNCNVYTFSSDGKYRLKLSANDHMGRSSEASCEFVIDRTPPKVDFHMGADLASQVKDIETLETMVLNTRPVFVIDTSDDLSEYDASAVLYKKDGDGTYKEELVENIASVGKSASFPIEVKSEGEYLLKVNLKDSAANTCEKSVSFIVDEKPPVIGYIDAFNEKYLKYFTLPESMKEYITDATKVKYKAYLNAKEVSSLELKKDGKYILQIVAEDEAGNISEEMAAFIVDNTLPKVIVQGIESGGNVKKDNVVKLTLFDGNDYFKSVTVNGEAINIRDNREINIKADSYGDYNISVVAADYAGNEITEVVTMQCALADNPFKVKINESDIKTLTKNDDQIRESFFDRIGGVKMLILCTIAVVGVALLGIFTFVDTKKNKG